MAVGTRISLITGGGRGIGRAIADRLAGDGFTVGLVARTTDQVEEVARSIVASGGRARAFPADVLAAPVFDRAVARFLDWSGGCDTLICAAGRLGAIGPLPAVEPESWWLDLETSVRGAERAIRLTLPALREAGGASIQVLVGPGHHAELAFASGYAAGQAALVRLVECLDVEFRADALRTYAINPGIVPTELLQPTIETPAGRRWLPRFHEAMAEGKEVGPEVAAEMVAWLATERPAALSGRVVAALTPPEILETRLTRIEADDLGRLRVR